MMMMTINDQIVVVVDIVAEDIIVVDVAYIRATSEVVISAQVSHVQVLFIAEISPYLAESDFLFPSEGRCNIALVYCVHSSAGIAPCSAITCAYNDRLVVCSVITLRCSSHIVISTAVCDSNRNSK